MKFFLRELKQKDAPLMLEWMHDSSVTEFMRTDFANKNLSDCEKFIKESQEYNQNFHLAIADEEDVYIGTVSLKNINKNSAEFAITVRQESMGTGAASFAITRMLNIGHERLGLENIYWYVSNVNKRAIRFYEKGKYQRVSIEKICSLIDAECENMALSNTYIWYLSRKNNHRE